MIDTAIVKNSGDRIFDFFMISNQNPRTATAIPVHYKVVHNTSNMNKLEIEEFTYQQCYMYYGFYQSAVKVPAIVKYAHKKAFHAYDNKYAQRNGSNIPMNKSLQNYLHFL